MWPISAIYIYLPHTEKKGGKATTACDITPTYEDIRPPATRNPPRNIAGLYRRHVYEVELESNFAGIPAVKTDMASVAGDFCSHISYVAGSSAASRPGRHLRTRGGRCWRATKVAPSTGTRGGGWGDESFFDQSRQMITDTPVDGKNGNLNRRTSKHHVRFGHMRVLRNLKACSSHIPCCASYVCSENF